MLKLIIDSDNRFWIINPDDICYVCNQNSNSQIKITFKSQEFPIFMMLSICDFYKQLKNEN